MGDFNFSNQSQSSDSNSMNQTPAHMSNLSLFSMNLTQASSVKLDKDNFLLWKNVIMPVVRGHGLEGYLLGSKVCPPQFINSQITPEIGSTMEMIPNPEYSRWISVDQLLMGWMYSSMTPEIVMRVMGCNSLSELWKAINEITTTDFPLRTFRPGAIPCAVSLRTVHWRLGSKLDLLRVPSDSNP
ncbi:Uncharacterized protein Adt_09578 [Abeliophyllum distichum]|uniref:Retrotransposon Copia-like N-terminal domain-containing protein n=1 Tax=Abeliophyllum distichum TaxID=126358 RepID=A0ABD1UHL6_9LAMI